MSSQSLVEFLGLHSLTILIISLSSTGVKNMEVMFTNIITYRCIFYSWECIGTIWSDSSKECIKFVGND